MRVKKPQSKRKSTKLQEGVKKKVAAHNRKERKKQKKDITWKSRLPKDPGIPNSFPYKAELLAEVEEQKQRKQEEKQARRQQQREQARKSGYSDEQIDQEFEDQDRQDNSNRLAALMESAEAAINEYDAEHDDDDEDDEEEDEEIQVHTGTLDKESSRKAYDKIYKTIVEHSDVILYVLDSRNPQGTRSKQVEEAVLAHPEKRLLFVLNKIDLIPDDVLRQWKDHLEMSFPVVPLAASSCAPNAQTFKHLGLTQGTTSQHLLGALKRYAGKMQKKRSIAVGIIGYPNVGKSSVINALTTRHGGNRQSCPVGAQAGVTTSIRKVKVDNKLSVWDSPGIVFPSEGEKKKKNPVEEQARLVLLNALPPKHIDDHRPAVSLLVRRLQKNPDLYERFKSTYDIPPMVEDPHDDYITSILVHMSRRTGRFKKGGVPDLGSAATALITDWRDGRLAGWALPPTRAEQQDKKSTGKNEPMTQDRIEVVSEWAAEFDLGGLWDNEGDVDME